MRLFNFLICQLCISSVFSGELAYPKAIRVTEGATIQMKSEFFPIKIYDPDDNTRTIVDMTGRALCVNDICSIPGPSLIVEPGTTFNIQLTNAFAAPECHRNDGNSPDTINIHSHGLHISGEQDNVFDTLFPTETETITWTVHQHTGTNWYHTHNHGTTAVQVMSGMYGALIVDKPSNSALDYNNPSEIHDYILDISWVFLHDNNKCRNCDYQDNYDWKMTNKLWRKFNYIDSFKYIISYCSLWCDLSQSSREKSGYKYDVSIHTNALNNQETKDYADFDAFEAFLVNNQYKPTMSNLPSNQYFKLRIISASSTLYIQLQFDYNQQTNCKYYMIARDGIALRDISRDLQLEPYYGFFMLPPGGRIDIKVLCTGSGSAVIKHKETHENYANIGDSYPMGRLEEQILVTLNINAPTSTTINDPSHLNYPEPTNGYPNYLSELFTDSGLTIDEYSQCPCNNYNRNEVEGNLLRNTNNCGLELIERDDDTQGYSNWEVNGISFSAIAQALYILQKNTVYEFYIDTDGHPFHIHVNPFSVEEDLLNGYIAKKGDMMDTIGYANLYGDDNSFKIKYNTKDFVGNVIIHCHFLGHEDNGMMGFLKIVDGEVNENTCMNYGYEKIEYSSAHGGLADVLDLEFISDSGSDYNYNGFKFMDVVYEYKFEIVVSVCVISMVIHVITCLWFNRNKNHSYAKVVNGKGVDDI